jgi:hypothetical protein
MGGHASFLNQSDLTWHGGPRRVPLSCPSAVWPLLRSLDSPRSVVETFIPSLGVVGSTYLSPAFALGSVNEGDLWNQRRAVIAYFGTVSSPLYLHLRFLKNGYDFASAYVNSQQRDALVVGAVYLVTDGGDTHISLNKVQGGKIAASDLRMRFELGGQVAAAVAATVITIDTAASTPSATISNGGVTFSIQIPYAKFDGGSVRLTSGAAGALAWLDVELYSGPSKQFDLIVMTEAVIGFLLSAMSTASAGFYVPPPGTSEVNNGTLTLDYDGLTIAVPTKPTKTSFVLDAIE